jgi:hypothetical protein
MDPVANMAGHLGDTYQSGRGPSWVVDLNEIVAIDIHADDG